MRLTVVLVPATVASLALNHGYSGLARYAGG